MRHIAFLPGLAVSLLLAPSAFGWGCEGHEIVALIARSHLTPAVSAAVDSLLRENPIDPALKRFCQDRPNDLMADSSTWADDVKNQEKTAVWHYIDIPLSVRSAPDLARWCPPIGPSVDHGNRPGCVTDAIDYEVGILGDKSRPAAERAAALRYVIHFVGDIHQPLHAEDNDDQGGNCTALRFFADERPANLHAVWDYELIQRELRKDKITVQAYAAALNARFAASGVKQEDPAAWAWESHAIAISAAYGDLNPAIPVAAPGSPADCAGERDRVRALHIAIGEAYFSQAMPVIDERLAQAGIRLANLLNTAL